MIEQKTISIGYQFSIEQKHLAGQHDQSSHGGRGGRRIKPSNEDRSAALITSHKTADLKKLQTLKTMDQIPSKIREPFRARQGHGSYNFLDTMSTGVFIELNPKQRNNEDIDRYVSVKSGKSMFMARERLLTTQNLQDNLHIRVFGQLKEWDAKLVSSKI